VESSDAAVLQRLLRDEVISQCRVEDTEELKTDKAAKMGQLVIPGTKDAAGVREAQANIEKAQRRDDDDEDESDDEFGGRDAEKDMTEYLREEDDDDDDIDQVHSFEIDGNMIQQVQERCNVTLAMPLTEEYDFRNDEQNAGLDIDLRPNVQIRYYQEHALSKMFGNGRARSGIIVLPCGAGKTLVGITAACTIKKSAIVLCTSAMSVVQWKEEFKKWSNINPDDIAIFTSGEKEKLNHKAGIIICTYSMVTQNTRRAHDSQQVMDFITSREWGLMVLDEVHVVPAEMFRRVTSKIKTHSKLGLTATLLREDDKIKDLNFLIGPKLYEANWLQLSEEGHIARVQCAEVWCPMTTEFYSEYINATGKVNQQSLLSTCLIQISSHYGSRRQEAQRLGRILRAKRRNDEGFNAFFYSLVSKDTNEMFYSSKRQAFLVDQGYAFKVITHLNGIDKMPNLAFTSQQERMSLLTDVLLQSETAGDVEDIKDDLFSDRNVARNKGRKGIKRQAGTLSSLAGGEHMAYMEYHKGSKAARDASRSAFFKKNDKNQERKKAAARKMMEEN
jgi:superfamily II DNA or RNA helicase